MGEIRIVEDTVEVIELESKKIGFDDIYTGYFNVVDSLILFVSPQYPDYYISVFNVSGRHLANLCRKGDGPGESIGVGSFIQFIKENDKTVGVLNSFNEEEIMFLDIYKSLAEKETYYDSISSLKWRMDYNFPFKNIWWLGRDSVLVRTPTQSMYDENEKKCLSMK